MTFQFPEPQRWEPSRHCQILSVAEEPPERRVDNAEIIARGKLGIPEQLVRRTVGVESRRVAPSGTSDSDLLAMAARKCLQRAGVGVDQLSRLVVNKFLGDRLLPPTASILQRKLGARMAFPCMDVDGGSHGFVQAFETASRCINSGDELVLIVSGGICHDLVCRTDLRTAFLFGDGAAAILLGPSEKRHILSTYGFCNPEFADLQTGVRFMDVVSIPHDAPDAEIRMRNLYSMGNWKDSLDFVLQAARTTLDRLLDSAGLSQDGVDRFLVSASTAPLRDAIVAHLGIPEAKAPCLLASRGNTMSANLPILLATLEEADPMPTGTVTAFLSFGEGISGGGILCRS